MFRLVDYRNAIVSSLHGGTGITVIPANSDGEKPPYPYIQYRITSPYIDTLGRDSTKNRMVNGRLETTHSKLVEFVYSFAAKSEDQDEAMEVCAMIIEHFTRIADLEAAGIVVVDNSAAFDRTAWFTEYYEHEWGTDIRFRAADVTVISDQDEGWIEDAIIEGGGIS